MSIKASKDDLARLLAADGANSFVAHDDTKTPIQPIEKITVQTTVLGQDPESDHLKPTSYIGSIEPTENLSTPVKVYRSQGLTIYESDDELIDGFLAYMRKKKLRIGRKKGFSLFARAGLRALEEVRQKTPAAFEEILVRALQEQK